MRLQQLLARRAWSLAALSFFAAVLWGGCGGAQEVEEEVVLPERARHGNLATVGLEVDEDDINLDGTPDQFIWSRGETTVRAERDLDFDGRIDLYEHYDGGGALVEQELQLDHDPAIDVVRFYVDGRLTRKEYSTEFGGRVTMWKFYDGDGVLLRVERDDDRDGQVDVWEDFEEGELVRIRRDTDGDGEPDTIQEAG